MRWHQYQALMTRTHWSKDTVWTEQNLISLRFLRNYFGQMHSARVRRFSSENDTCMRMWCRTIGPLLLRLSSHSLFHVGIQVALSFSRIKRSSGRSSIFWSPRRVSLLSMSRLQKDKKTRVKSLFFPLLSGFLSCGVFCLPSVVKYKKNLVSWLYSLYLHFHLPYLCCLPL